MSEDGVPAVAVQELRPLLEAFALEDDEHGNPIFLYSSFGYIDADYRAYFGQSKLRKYDLTRQHIQASPKALPDDDVYPLAPESVTVVSSETASQSYCKGPMLNTAFLGNGQLPKLIQQEVEVLELLKRHRHPNIVQYHGCVIERNRIVSLAFDKLPMTLYTRSSVDSSLDIAKCMHELTSAVSHLHALALAHNDLNPSNIMVDDHDNSIVIDFGSCRPFGEDLITAGSRGWIDHEYSTSAREHDESALRRIRSWLESVGEKEEANMHGAKLCTTLAHGPSSSEADDL